MAVPPTVYWGRGADIVMRSSGPARQTGSSSGKYILGFMDYSVGSRIRVRLYGGKVVEAEITAITNQSAGRKVQIVYGGVTVSINPAQITEVLPPQ